MLLGDPHRICQVLNNLLDNAFKFTETGGVSVRVQTEALLGGDDCVLRVQIADTGIGIPEADIQKALAVFGQVHRSQSHEGTGLGLPLCKMFAELHGGKLQLTSEVGVGTTVRVIFPETRVR